MKTNLEEPKGILVRGNRCIDNRN